MNLQNAVSRLTSWLPGNHRSEKLKLVQQQRLLLHQGLETIAEVLGISLCGEKVGRLLPIQLWLKLRTGNENYIYVHTKTLVSLNLIPAKGQILSIKYLPENLTQILIM